MAENLNIQVVYALPEQQELVSLSLAPGSTVLQALQASGLLEKHAVELATSKFGIYGKLAKLDAVLRDHDRVEIYRPLIADPKEVRKARAAEGKGMKKGGAKPQSPA
ncbi:MAG TPA: RnfH family protein [Rhodocyclaceae bacterium]|jgi:putative ubiquitin-RnfH superfamily antitoxin RatB of RatAB toxin-antitoxin module|nr:RnfH family protein [Rhodocyclaceae bacterium]